MPIILHINAGRALDLNGLSVPGARATFYDAGTANVRTVFSDPAGEIPHPTPLVANGSGIFPPIFDIGDGDVSVTITDADGVTLPGYPLSPLIRVNTDITGASSVSFEPTAEIPVPNVQDAIERVQANIVAPLAEFGLGVTGNSGLLDNIDATDIASGFYRYDGATTGTLPAGVTAGPGGIVEISRQSASMAKMILIPGGTVNQFIRELSDDWSSWTRVMNRNDTAANAVWSAGSSSTAYVVSPANIRAAVGGALNVSGGAPIYGARAWGRINGRTTNGACTILNSGNVASSERTSAGVYDVFFATNMPHGNYSVAAATNEAYTCRVFNQTASRFSLNFNAVFGGEPPSDPGNFHFQVVC